MFSFLIESCYTIMSQCRPTLCSNKYILELAFEHTILQKLLTVCHFLASDNSFQLHDSLLHLFPINFRDREICHQYNVICYDAGGDYRTLFEKAKRQTSYWVLDRPIILYDMHMLPTIILVVLVRVVLGYIDPIYVCYKKCNRFFCVHIVVVLATVFITRYVPTLSSTQTPRFRPLC